MKNERPEAEGAKLDEVFPRSSMVEVFYKVQTVEKVVEVPMADQTLQGTTQEVDIPVAPRREDTVGQLFVCFALSAFLPQEVPCGAS